MPTDAAARPAAAPQPAEPPRRISTRRLRIAAVAGAGVAVLIVGARLIGHAHSDSQLKHWTAAQAVPVVSTVSPSPDSAAQTLALPGDLQAFYNAQIYSRVSGYVHAWYFDIGARVKAGQLLATIDTPELDQQILQARANVQSAQANVELAKTTADRWARLLTQDAVSKQEADEKAGDYRAKAAQLNAVKADLNRLLAMKGFARIVAPFDGTVTARKTDIGALVNAGAAATPNSELFDIAKTDPLRLYVHVPQNDSAQIHPGMTASLTVPEYPGRSFAARLTTTAGAVSDASGTVLAELSVNNSSGALKPGDFAQVRLDLAEGPGAGGGLLAPSSVLLFRSKGPQVAVLTPDDHVGLRPVTIGRDLGPQIEITSGLQASDRLIDNPPDSISDGELVRVVAPAGRPASTAAAASARR